MAKNITDFIPGFAESTEMVDACEFIFLASTNPGDNRNTSYGNGCGRYCFQCDHSYQGTVTVRFFGSGGSSGGVCCCMNGAAGSSGSYIKYEAEPTACKRLCWKVDAGGCCFPQNPGGGTCYQWYKDETIMPNGCVVLSPGWCHCTGCNFPTIEHNYEVCYMTYCYDYTNCGAFSSYDCRNCYYRAGAHSDPFPFDSEGLGGGTTFFRKRAGFISTGECQNTGSCICKVTAFRSFPAVADGRKEYFIGAKLGGENCVGGSLQNCQTRSFFGSQPGGGSQTSYSHICHAGSGGMTGTAQGGNCYCGGPETNGNFVSLTYKLTEPPTG